MACHLPDFNRWFGGESILKSKRTFWLKVLVINSTEATDKMFCEWCLQKSNGPPQSQQPLICSAIIHFRCGDFATYPQARRKSIFLQQGLFRKLFLQRNSPLIKIACSNLHFFIFCIFMGMQHSSLGFVSFHVQIFCQKILSNILKYLFYVSKKK